MSINDQLGKLIRESLSKPPQGKTVSKVLIIGALLLGVSYCFAESYTRFYLPRRTEIEAKKLLSERREREKW